MERGTVSYRHSAGGTISRPGNVGIRFYSSGIDPRDRDGLRKGDAVCFEVEINQNDHMAINIRKSHPGAR